MEVYIDDMLIKSIERLDHANHLQQAFDILRTYGMKLNPAKCVLEVNAGQFLGFMMTQRGIEANPSQLKAILESPAPSSRKEVQQLIGRLATLGRFISRFTDCLKPFFSTLRGAKRAEWNEECDRAFTQIKQYLAEPSIYASPDTGETLFVYLAVLDTTVSAALFKENEDGKQRPMFFIRKSLADVETRYSHLEQAALALRIAAKKLRPYFQVHPIVVLTDLPLWSTIHKPDLSRRMACWAVELSEYGIQYKPRLSKKGQVLVDFIAELPQSETCPRNLDWWTLNIDRASRQSEVGIGLQLRTQSRDKIKQAIRLGFSASNNESEYEAILAGLELAAALSVDRLSIRSDSQLVVGQVNKEFKSRDHRMEKYVSRVKQRLNSFLV